MNILCLAWCRLRAQNGIQLSLSLQRGFSLLHLNRLWTLHLVMVLCLFFLHQSTSAYVQRLLVDIPFSLVWTCYWIASNNRSLWQALIKRHFNRSMAFLESLSSYQLVFAMYASIRKGLAHSNHGFPPAGLPPDPAMALPWLSPPPLLLQSPPHQKRKTRPPFLASIMVRSPRSRSLTSGTPSPSSAGKRTR